MGLLFNDIKGTIERPFCRALLPATHDSIDKFGDQRIVIFGVRQYFPLFDLSLSGHKSSFFLVDGWVWKRSLTTWVSWLRIWNGPVSGLGRPRNLRCHG